jgi:23S rRNA pseudouridine2605 synthase
MKQSSVNSPPAKKRDQPTQNNQEGERIAKIMARSGLCSRRDAERWIEEGRVKLNGRVLRTPAVKVSAKDHVLVDNRPLPMSERTRLFLYHKPSGLVVSDRDEKGRPTIYDKLDKDLPRLKAVGRLDINTEGLLLLTNDGGLKRILELPSTGWTRRYRVRAYRAEAGEVSQDQLDQLQKGITLEGIHYAPIKAEIERQKGTHIWLTMDLKEGKNREIKNVLESLGLQVARLIRLSYGPFQLGDMAKGTLKEVRPKTLKEQLGAKLIARSGARFD